MAMSQKRKKEGVARVHIKPADSSHGRSGKGATKEVTTSMQAAASHLPNPLGEGERKKKEKGVLLRENPREYSVSTPLCRKEPKFCDAHTLSISRLALGSQFFNPNVQKGESTQIAPLTRNAANRNWRQLSDTSPRRHERKGNGERKGDWPDSKSD